MSRRTMKGHRSPYREPKDYSELEETLHRDAQRKQENVARWETPATARANRLSADAYHYHPQEA